MKHIKTTSEKEASAKKSYANSEPKGEIEATPAIKDAAAELLKTLKEIDVLKLKASTITGEIMDFMKEAEVLKSGGKTLATWGFGRSSKKIDYDTILAMYKVSTEDILANTVVTRTVRTFSLED